MANNKVSFMHHCSYNAEKECFAADQIVELESNKRFVLQLEPFGPQVKSKKIYFEATILSSAGDPIVFGIGLAPKSYDEGMYIIKIFWNFF